MMTIFTSVFIHHKVLCVLLPLLFFCFLPFVSCQQESKSGNLNRIANDSTRLIIVIISIGVFISSMLFCCLFYVFYRVVLIAAEGRTEVLQSVLETNGIDKGNIMTLPLFLYSEIKGLKINKGGEECEICLNEFEDEETLRWLPPCSHTFHANCIDMWLSSSSTCPVCRANLALNPGESFTCSIMDIEMGNAPRSVLTGNNNGSYRIPRSRSTELLSRGPTAEILYLRSHSTGHSLEQLGESVERFTLQLPEEVHRHLVSLNLIRRSHIALPHARRLGQGYRSGSVGSSHRDGLV